MATNIKFNELKFVSLRARVRAGEKKLLLCKSAKRPVSEREKELNSFHPKNGFFSPAELDDVDDDDDEKKWRSERSRRMVEEEAGLAIYYSTSSLNLIRVPLYDFNVFTKM
jgi:hypothetical protein